MFNALSVFATILSVACAVLIQHVIIRFNKVEEGYENWSQSLSDDCNRNLQVYYTMLCDAMKKDVTAYFDKLENPVVEDLSDSVEDLSDVESYIDENDIKITVE